MDIAEYKVKLDNGKIKVTGLFAGSAGEFEVKFQGDGGNADTYEFKLWGGQFENVQFTITGAWEFGEVVSLMKLIEKIRYN